MTWIWWIAVTAAAGLAVWLGRARRTTVRPPVFLLWLFAVLCGLGVAAGMLTVDIALNRPSAPGLPALATVTGVLLVTATAWRRGGCRAAGVLAPAALLVSIGVVVGCRTRVR